MNAGLSHADHSPLLNRRSPSLTNSDSHKSFHLEDGEIKRRIRGEISRYRKREVFEDVEFMNMTEEVILRFLSGHYKVEYSPFLIFICAPVVLVTKNENSAFLCFEGLMKRLGTSDLLKEF